MTPAELLRAGRERIARGWTQRNFATDSRGQECEPESERASCFCALGALRASAGGLFPDYFEAAAVLSLALPKEAQRADDPGGEDPVAAFNDATTTRAVDVLALYDAAIAAAERGGS